MESLCNQCSYKKDCVRHLKRPYKIIRLCENYQKIRFSIFRKKVMRRTENHEITLKFNSTEDLQKACKELSREGYLISDVSDYDITTIAVQDKGV